MKLLKQTQQMFPEYNMAETDGGFIGCVISNRTEYRDENKNRVINTGMKFIYVSPEMYPQTDRDFRYALQYERGRMKEYRCREWREIEINKRFASGKTDNELIESIKTNFQ